MRRKISISNNKSGAYLYNDLAKQFKRALQQHSMGEMLSSKQILQVFSCMGYLEEQPSQKDVQLSRTVMKMLSEFQGASVRRTNLWRFLLVLCDIPEVKDSSQSSCFEEEASGLAMDAEEKEQEPLIVVKIGHFENNGRWHCTKEEKQHLQSVFACMRDRRMANRQIEARKRDREKQDKQNNNQTFQPKICNKSVTIFQQKLKKIKQVGERVQNRLILSRHSFKQKVQEQMNKSMQKQLQGCTFKPRINKSRSMSKQNLRSHSQDHLKILLSKGQTYKQNRQKLKQLKIQLNESAELQKCTFYPHTTKHSQTTKLVYVRNRDKQIQRLREGRKQRQFINQIKDRGYPQEVSWSGFLSQKTSALRQPILSFDLRMMNEHYGVDAFEGDNIVDIAQKISKEHNMPQNMWWKVEDIIRKAVEQCSDIRVQNNRILAK